MKFGFSATCSIQRLAQRVCKYSWSIEFILEINWFVLSILFFSLISTIQNFLPKEAFFISQRMHLLMSGMWLISRKKSICLDNKVTNSLSTSNQGLSLHIHLGEILSGKLSDIQTGLWSEITIQVYSYDLILLSVRMIRFRKRCGVLRKEYCLDAGFMYFHASIIP